MPTHPAGVDSPDSALVARAASGDERALGELYDRYGGMTFSLACAIVGEHADAEEVVADAFAQVWRSAASFDPARGSVAAWVATIARTRALDLVRSRRRRARVLEEAAVVTDEGEALVLAPSLEPADRNAEVTETSALVRRSLADLPAPQRRVIELAYFGGLSQSEIATQLSDTAYQVSTFGEDDAGELYFADYATGDIYKFAETAPPANPVLSLSASSIAFGSVTVGQSATRPLTVTGGGSPWTIARTFSASSTAGARPGPGVIPGPCAARMKRS